MIILDAKVKQPLEDAAALAALDPDEFWEDSEYARESYVSDPPSDELIAEIEQELGYKLPASYIALMKQQNGGIPRNTNFPTTEATSWAQDHVALTGIMGIGRDKDYSLGGGLGSRFMMEEWGYPDIGVYFADCPSAGHDMIVLDYSACGPDGEPTVAHVDQEGDYHITPLAPNFAAFVLGLVHDDEYDTSEEDKAEALEMAQNAAFSPLLSELCDAVREVADVEGAIRRISTDLIEEKGFFALHADERSQLLYDVQLWLFTNQYPQTTREHYLERYTEMIAFGQPFGTRGYAPGFVTDWLDERLQSGRIVEQGGYLAPSAEEETALIKRLRAIAAE
ncbi:SMI1/KNR4 family protein [Paenibacillus daejeonensis]|uniref:SMI1/KNR4 family protein n=1 Tax=Paenibacillus daejeonensis TaxID=135193 RepID=UPI003CCBDADE